jgi:hypothetical protein
MLRGFRWTGEPGRDSGKQAARRKSPSFQLITPVDASGAAKRASSVVFLFYFIFISYAPRLGCGDTWQRKNCPRFELLAYLPSIYFVALGQ